MIESKSDSTLGYMMILAAVKWRLTLVCEEIILHGPSEMY